jgi:hypothetical protein
MKKIILTLILSLPLTLAAQTNERKWGFAFGAGLMSDKGLLGFGIDLPVDDGYAGVDFGIDTSGLILALNYKHTVYSMPSGKEWFEKCFFIWDCNTKVLVGASIKSFSGQTVWLRHDDPDEGEYEVGPKYGVGVSAGFRNEFKSGWFSDVDVTYRTKISKPTVKFVGGVSQDDDYDDLTATDIGLGIGVTLGYRFTP